VRILPGLFSQYIMVTPYFLFSYSQNFYLDIFFEQGLFGGIAILILVLGAAWMLARRVWDAGEVSLVGYLSEAVLVGILIMLIHGLVDDPLYGDAGTPLLLLLPSLAIMLFNIENPSLTIMDQFDDAENASKDSLMRRLIIPGIVLIVFFSLGVTLRKSLFASWYANLGAVEMSRLELVNWPQDQWNANPDVTPLAHSASLFKEALAFNPDERTALHRLGLISMQRRDFSAARLDLERAFNIDPDHRGIRKSLGYAYVWDSNLENAGLMLQGIDEAEKEMEIYSWWWREYNRQDLAAQAGEMLSILESINQ